MHSCIAQARVVALRQKFPNQPIMHPSAFHTPTGSWRAKPTKYTSGAAVTIIKMSLNENSASVKGEPPPGRLPLGYVS